MANKALLVGINAYPGQPLNGCVNDVHDMAQLLVDRCNFKANEIRLVVDGRATTAAIRDRLGWLVAGAKKGDRLLFHYSGHGTRFPVRDAHGNVASVHDAICPVDFDWSDEHVLLDDELRKILDKIRDDVEFIYVSDSCNSGDLTRAVRPWRARFMVPPVDIQWRLRTAEEMKIPVSQIAHDRCGLISGCRSDQESADAVFGGRYNGALTYYLVRVLNRHGGLALPLTQLVPQLVDELRHGGYTQEPQLRGPDFVKSRSFLAASMAGAAKSPAEA